LTSAFKAALQFKTIGGTSGFRTPATVHFGLPREIDCHVADGRDFLRGDRHRYDAIVLDAYSERRIPDHLSAETFFGLVQARLENTYGCLIAKCSCPHDLDMMPDLVASKLRQSGPT
jgi:spermidine synthase